MKKFNLFLIVMTLMFAFTTVASAQTFTAGGTLTVTANVTGQINLVFNTDPQGLTLTGSGTPNASFDFGTISAFNTLPAKVTRTFTSGVGFTVSTPVDVFVDKSNVNSANYQLTAKLNAPDTNYNWFVNTIGINSTTASQITATGTYATNVQETIAINVPVGAPAGTISNSIAFTAQAN